MMSKKPCPVSYSDYKKMDKTSYTHSKVILQYIYLYSGHQYRSAGHHIHPGGGVGLRGHLQAGGEGTQSTGTEVTIKI